MQNYKSKFKIKEKQRITRITQILTKQTLFSILRKMIILNLFVKFVQFVVKKWVVGWKTKKNSVCSVVKYSGVRLCGLCVFYSFCFLIFDILFPMIGEIK